MNDRCVSLLENYDIEVLRTWKGRGAILCESNQGTLILKEYAARREKSIFQEAVLHRIQEHGFPMVEAIIRNKEGELLTTDQDGVCYVLKTYFEGKECDVREEKDCMKAMQMLARLHKATLSEEELPGFGNACMVSQEFEKHNKELRRVRKFLKEKSQKNDFEIYLMQCFDYFFNVAMQTLKEYQSLADRKELNRRGYVCHGEFQHHNIIFSGNDICIINFEKCVKDSPVRDIYLFMRKLMEKNNWQQETAFLLLEAYETINPLEKEDYESLYYRFAYPEKFWKIVNFYYNSGKSWIPGKNLEKLIRIKEQEKEKTDFLETFKQKYGILSV